MITSTRPCNLTPRAGVRTILPGDAGILGPLMYHAYHGSLDDEGETPDSSEEEMRATLAGRYGRLLWDASFIMVDGDQAIGATIVTDDTAEGAPLLAFCMTHPDAQGKGVATHLVQASIDALHAMAAPRFALHVARANVGAIRLYERLGFTLVSAVTSPDAHDTRAVFDDTTSVGALS